MSRRVLPVATYLAAAVMELCWLAFGLMLIMSHMGLREISLALILLTYLLAFSRELVASQKLALLTLAGAALAVTLVTALAVLDMFNSGYPVGGVIFQLIFSGAAWWLGNSLVREEIDFRYICYRFQIGILALLGFNLFDGGPLLAVLFFFITAAFALALARWEDSLSHSTGALQPFRLGLNTAGALAVLLPSAIIFVVFSPDAARAIVRWLAALGSGLANLLSVPASGSNPAPDFNWSCSMKSDENLMPPTSPPAPGPPMDVSPLVFWMVILVVFLVVMWIVFITARTMIKRRNQSSRVTKIETSPIQLGWLGWLNGIGKKLLRLLVFLFKFRWGKRRLPEEEIGSMRALYRTFLQWAEKALPRAQSQTPLEYQKALSQKLPGKGPELQLITGAYVRARYGRNPETSEEFEAARAAWRKVKFP